MRNSIRAALTAVPWVMLRVILASEDHNDITAGHTVTLPCRASNTSITAAEWRRPDQKPEYVLLTRDGHFDPAKQHPSFQNRVELQDRHMKDGDVSLILHNVTINDTGTYECRVFMEETRSWKSISTIYLSVPPPDQKNITAESGQNVTLTCRAPNNNIKPIIVVEWSRADLESDYVFLYRDEQFNPEHQHPYFKNRVDLQDRQMKDGDVSVILKNVTINDTGTYECHVRERERERLKWKLRERRAFISASPKFIPAESGRNVTLPCRAPNSNISIIVTEWSRADLEKEYVLLYRDEQFDPDDQHPAFKNRVDLQDRQMKDGDVSLILKDVTINDTGTYECRVFQRGKNRGKRAHLMTEPISIIYLRVVAPPEQKNITALPGQNVTLPCRAANNKEPIIVAEWSRPDLGDEYVLQYRDERFDPENQHPAFKNRVDLQDQQMKDGDVSLILKDVTFNDTATYECRVFQRGTNRRKRADLKTEPISIITLRVVAPPGQPAGSNGDGGKEEDGSVALIAGLSVLAVVLVAASVGFMIFRNQIKQFC
ncbi:polymeric immunoglobulin receptor-like [Archocentrus centrarchus]|uniref:polymeric immunoglobulin receptor-like n=1 Tax=Archocentrus centrarchus TaxID=63155 RepID=UPI0011EA39EE|nr:polymeric immunoglobulin receptor-like [Archocentrus centrarchus]